MKYCTFSYLIVVNMSHVDLHVQLDRRTSLVKVSCHSKSRLWRDAFVLKTKIGLISLRNQPRSLESPMASRGRNLHPYSAKHRLPLYMPTSLINLISLEKYRALVNHAHRFLKNVQKQCYIPPGANHYRVG